jgi:hypothetical protein
MLAITAPLSFVAVTSCILIHTTSTAFAVSKLSLIAVAICTRKNSFTSYQIVVPLAFVRSTFNIA